MAIDPRELEQHFAELSEAAPQERADSLRALQAQSPELARRLALLLDAHESTRDPLSGLHTKAVKQISGFDPDSLIGRELDGWRLLGLIGRGGMGVVYEATRSADGVTQSAAIKLLSAPLFDQRAADRFVAEARALARLDHPGICRLRDWGRSPEGWPYLVLDLVRGVPLPVGDVQRTLQEKLALMARIADAVAAAHRQLVAHLDLKPGNVLIADSGRPVLLDFGVSRVLIDEPTAGATLTRWLTPRYASPEQLRGESADASADIYALGVMLYEQVTGKPPFELEGVPVTEALRRIEQGIPNARRRNRILPRDLAAICARAMHADPERRYTSADAFADDLRALLDRRPVSARPDSLAYQASRLIARHPIAVPGSLVAAIAIVGLVILLGFQAHDLRRQRDRAEAAARRAESATGLLLDSIRAADPTGESGDKLTFSDLIDQTEARIDEELANSPQLYFDALMTLADVRRALGQNDQAIPMYQRADGLLQSLPNDDTDRPTMAHKLAFGLTEALRGADKVEQAIDTVEAALSQSGDSPPADLLMALARAELDQSRDNEAESAVQRALLAMDEDDADAHADAFALLGEVESIRYHYAESLKWQQLALERLGDDKHNRNRRAKLLSSMAFNHSRLNDHDQAEAEASKAVDLRVAQYGENHPATVLALRDLGYVLDDSGKWDQALQVAERAMRAEQIVSGGESRRMERLLSFASTTHRRLEDSETALTLLLQAKALGERLYPPGHRLLGNIYGNLGALYADLGDIPASIEAHRRAYAIYDAKADDGPSRGRFIAAANLASGLCESDQAEEGIEWGARAEREAEQLMSPDSLMVANVRMILAKCYLKNGNLAQAETLARSVQRTYETSDVPVAASARKSNLDLLGRIEKVIGNPRKSVTSGQAGTAGEKASGT